MKESRLMQLQYATAVAALFLVGLHLLMQGVIVPYSQALSFGWVLSLYRGWATAGLLEILLIVVVAHGFNGLRIILLEWRQTKAWTIWVTRGSFLAALALIIYGTRTVVLAAFGGLG